MTMDRRTANIDDLRASRCVFSLCSFLCVLLAGCYAPIHSPGIAAHTLPDDFRWPTRTSAAPLNYSHLVGQAPIVYLLGPGDTLKITAPDLIAQGHSEPFDVQVLDHGEVYLPRLGPVFVGGLSVAQAQQRVNQALSNGLLNNPNTVVMLTEKGTVNVLVLGAVENPGVHALPRYENDVAHALAAAQGFAEDAGDVIEIHRRGSCVTPMMGSYQRLNAPASQTQGTVGPGRATTAPASTGYSLSSSNLSQNASVTLSAPHQLPQSTNPVGVPAGGMVTTTAFRSPNQQARSIRDVDYGNVVVPFPGPNVIEASRFQSSFDNSDRRMQYSLPNAPEAKPRNNSATLPENTRKSPRSIIRGQSPAQGVHGGEFRCDGAQSIVRIPLRGGFGSINPSDVVLNPGDVLVIPRKTDKVFYVVGPLSEQNSIRFSVNNKDREIGGGLLLPDDREIDVVTAVAMAGYIDPIESPTTVTVHRIMPDRTPLLIRVDLIAARSNPQETVMIQAGDIVYLNPDAWWYGRRTFDRVIERALGTAVGRWLTN